MLSLGEIKEGDRLIWIHRLKKRDKFFERLAVVVLRIGTGKVIVRVEGRKRDARRAVYPWNLRRPRAGE